MPASTPGPNPATLLARAVLEELVAGGVRELVLSPGSRSAPLAFEALRLARMGQLRLHVRIDERSAGFLGLGLAKVSGDPVAVVCTSGTAVANLAPAVVEASYSAVPLVALTADRPPEARGVGSPQTIDQAGFFGRAVRLCVDLDVPEAAPGGALQGACTAVRGALAACRGELPNGHGTGPGEGRGPEGTGVPHAGPVHVNVSFRFPLVPQEWSAGTRRPGAAEGTPRAPRSAPDLGAGGAVVGAGGAAVAAGGGAAFEDALGAPAVRGLILVGDLPGPVGSDPHADLVALADACGWPIIAEPSANLHPHALGHGVLVLAAGDFMDRHEPDLVLTAGVFGLSRPTLGVLRRARRHVAIELSSVGREVCDPLRTAQAVLTGVPRPPVRVDPDPSWLRDWRAADDVAASVVAQRLPRAGSSLTGCEVASRVVSAADDRSLLLVAASWPIRQVEAVAGSRRGVRIIGNRGANGIDGLVSTAWGAALAHQSAGGGGAAALVGDLAFLHDHNGLLAGADQPRPDLTLVVVDNDGGGIFHQLEQGAAQYADAFEPLFGTPLARDLVAVARAAGVPAERVMTTDQLDRALAAEVPGVRVIVAHAPDRAGEAVLLDAIRFDVAQHLSR